MGTRDRKALEVVAMMKRRKMEVLLIRETKWKGDRARKKAGGGIQDAARRRRRYRSNGVGIIVNVEISKEVVRVERWQGRIIAVWMMMRQHMVCVICVYGTQAGRMEAEKEAFREEVERLVGLSDGQTMLCVAGDFNTHIGVVDPRDEESIGRFGWGTRNREGRELVEMLRRNGLAVAGTFFQKKESHKITYMSGRHKTELDILVVWQQQPRRVKDCNALAGDYVTTQHKPVVFEVRMKKWKEKRTMGPKNIKWWKYKDEMMVEHREMVRRKYEELDAEKGVV